MYCSLSKRPKRCLAGLWIDTWEVESSKRIFDLLYSHKNEIEAGIPFKLVWDRKNNNRACSIDVVLDGVDFGEPEHWKAMADFQSKVTVELAEKIVYKYRTEIEDAAKA